MCVNIARKEGRQPNNRGFDSPKGERELGRQRKGPFKGLVLKKKKKKGTRSHEPKGCRRPSHNLGGENSRHNTREEEGPKEKKARATRVCPAGSHPW